MRLELMSIGSERMARPPSDGWTDLAPGGFARGYARTITA